MAHTAWEKAQEWLAQTNIRKLMPDDIDNLNIRQLKLVASAINAQEGLIISKAQFGKSLSNMTKAELQLAVWHWRACLMDCPKAPQPEWVDNVQGNVAYTCVYGAVWTVSVGFETEQQAYKFYREVLTKKWCRMACLRSGKRTGCLWEVKLWDIKTELMQLLNPPEDSTEMLVPQPEPQPEPVPASTRKLIEIWKPNGAYQFYEGDARLCGVYTKQEVAHEIEKHLNAGHQVQLHDPKDSRKVYDAYLKDGQIKYAVAF